MPAVGSHVPQAKLSGAWKNWSKFFARHNGSWKRPVSVHVKSGGSWVKVYDERPTVTNVYTTVSDAGQGGVFLYKYGNVTNYGFTATVTTTGNVLSQDSIAIDTQVINLYAITILPAGSPYYGYPNITVTNSSGSITF